MTGARAALLYSVGLSAEPVTGFPETSPLQAFHAVAETAGGIQGLQKRDPESRHR